MIKEKERKDGGKEMLGHIEGMKRSRRLEQMTREEKKLGEGKNRDKEREKS